MKAEHHTFTLAIVAAAPVEQSSAPRATLRFTLGAGVTPAARRAGDYFFTLFSSPLSWGPQCKKQTPKHRLA
jgi:hypothetical protein